ncbi:efflux transporter outer membrane subunit [Mitsuaria sp. GD03876]|uniref:efflux transporter outer membrane subunit n=1 Tax=Mitsuaria sp. GD03876 TaxID=2975399 RepID=UPI002447994A|nr:efflux transporter outer membrane subunit [Mitsuaria sp. GD03876]MDH0865389.1 efflux transporter outer membrane subunit [Mitsuaria sp. GD03876]
MFEHAPFPRSRPRAGSRSRPDPRGAGFAAATLAVAISGCASGPVDQAPAVPSSAHGAFVHRSDPVESAAEPPDDWWRLYDDPVLDRLIADALAANTTLREAVAHLRRAQAVEAEARAGLWPGTAVSAGASSGRNPAASGGTGLPPVQWTYTGQVNLSYEVDLFDRVDQTLKAARSDREASEGARDAAIVVVVSEVTRAYSDACAAAASAAVSRQSLDIAGRVLAMARRRHEIGAAPEIDVQRADLAVAQARAQLPQWEGQQAAALLALAALMGRTPAEIPEAARQCSTVPTPLGPLPVGDGAGLLRRRPDVRQAERHLAGDLARVGIATAELYPRVTIGASGGYTRNDSLRGSRSWSFGIGPLVSWTFPNRVAVQARLAQAKADGAASLARFDSTVLTALKETETTLAAYASAMAQKDALAVAQDKAAAVFEVARKRYEAGAASELELDLARADLTSIAAQVASVEQRVGSTRVDVFKALGGGWASASR